MKNKSAFLIILAAMLWGIDGIVLTPNLYSLPVTFVVFIQSMLITSLLTPISIKSYKNILSQPLKNHLLFVLVALFGGLIGTLSITKALFYVNYVNLSVVVLIQKLQPVFALILSYIILKEKLPAGFFVLAVFAIIGTYLMTFGLSLPQFSSDAHILKATFFSLIAAISFSFSTVISKKALNFINYNELTFLRFFYTFVFSFLIVGYYSEFGKFPDISITQWIIFVLIAIFTGGTAIFLYYYGLKNIKASIATICELAFPLTAIILEFIIRGNILGKTQWLGVIILIGSILIIVNKEK